MLSVLYLNAEIRNYYLAFFFTNYYNSQKLYYNLQKNSVTFRVNLQRFKQSCQFALQLTAI